MGARTASTAAASFWVVVPCFNEARGIEPTLRALRDQDDRNFVDTRLVGYIDFDTNKQTIHSFRLVTDDGRYGGDVNGMQLFGVTARSVSAPS